MGGGGVTHCLLIQSATDSRMRSLIVALPLVAVTSFFSIQPRLKERALADIAIVGVPTDLKGPENAAPRQAVMGRLSWSFSSTYLWVSMGSITKYKQKLVVALMAPDATAAEYAELPFGMDIGYEQRKQIRRDVMGSGTLTVWECVYALGVDREAAYEYLYVDRSRRLQIAWHAVAKIVDLNTGLAQIPRIASSFRIVREPTTLFAEMRDAPRKDAAARTSKLATVQAMLQREGYGVPEAGKPILRNGAYLEWASDPEPRYQLLVPLGRMRAAANGSVVNRPRPIRGNSSAPLAGTIGWREVEDGDWRFMNDDNAYLPFKGIGDALAARQQDRGFVYFYYVATVRVEETDDDKLLTSLKWFFDDLPQVQRRWRDGTLVGPGRPEND